MMRRIGVDVGGTNTDAVLLEGEVVRQAVKTPTTRDVTSGVTKALKTLLCKVGDSTVPIDGVMIGTTHFTNAVAERRDLERVAAVRICLPAAASLPPFIDWPEDLRAVVSGATYLLKGGHEYDGRPLVPFDSAEMRDVAKRIRDSGIRSVAVTSVFSPVNSTFEQEAEAILRDICPEINITLSHTIGRIGLLERENATLLNACLCDLAHRTVESFRVALRDLQLEPKLFLTQNDGTVMRAELAKRFPVFSFASGPTNSMRGAAFLSKLKEAIVIDVGGTTTDIGVLKNGFPREANATARIGGVRTLFRMPDILSLGLGGGSVISRSPVSIGPQSVGFELIERAVVFGGSELTCTDVAVARGLVDLGDRQRVQSLDNELVEAVLGDIAIRIETGIDRMKTDAADALVLAVGGGSFLIPRRIAGVSEVVEVPHHDVANAVGAAIAQVSGEIDRVFRDVPRGEAIAEARRIAEAQAIRAGAQKETLEVVDVEDLPLSYMPGNALRVRVRVVGDIG
jgi:N-methylhydantoinase A/oxoprolinase/acetone carboxylase beta subunit